LLVAEAREDSFTAREDFTPEALTPPVIRHLLGREGTLLLTFLCPRALAQTAHMLLLGLQHRSQPRDPFAIVSDARIHYSGDNQVALVAREKRKKNYERTQGTWLGLRD